MPLLGYNVQSTLNRTRIQKESIMANAKPKKDKQEETAEEFVKRMATKGSKRNGLRRRMGHHHKG